MVGRPVLPLAGDRHLGSKLENGRTSSDTTGRHSETKKKPEQERGGGL